MEPIKKNQEDVIYKQKILTLLKNFPTIIPYMDEMAKITDRLQYIFLKTVINGVRGKQFTLKETKQWAIEFLQMKPFKTPQDAKEKMEKFVVNKPALLQLKKYMHAYDEEKHLEAIIEKMKKHLQKNEIDEALHVAKTH